jgi:hypothetical protein
MLRLRRGRTFVGAVLLVVLSGAFFAIPAEEKSGGFFAVEPQSRVELRAPAAGFLKAV